MEELTDNKHIRIWIPSNQGWKPGPWIRTEEVTTGGGGIVGTVCHHNHAMAGRAEKQEGHHLPTEAVG